MNSVPQILRQKCEHFYPLNCVLLNTNNLKIQRASNFIIIIFVYSAFDVYLRCLLNHNDNRSDSDVLLRTFM
jgi:hypothetical protein